MIGRRFALAAATACALAVAPHAASADMGTAPVGPQGIYVSFEGGYLNQDLDSLIGHGVGSFSDIHVSPEDGFFLGGLIGYENGTPFVFGFHRIELYFLYGSAEDSTKTNDANLAMVNGAILAIDGVYGRTKAERDTWEGALRFEDDDRINATSTVTWVFAPFIRNFDEGVYSFAQGPATCGGPPCAAWRNSDVDNWLYGVYIAAEPETWVTQNLAFVARVGVGIYGYDADGKFKSASNGTPDFFAASVSDGDSGVGFRGLLGIGFKLKLAPTINLEGFGEADYFSDVGTAVIATNQPITYVSYVDNDDLWEFRTGLRLTVGLGPAN